jgi:hypothetical protein
MVDADMSYIGLVLSQGLGNQNLLTHSTCSVESRIIWCHEPGHDTELVNADHKL